MKMYVGASDHVAAADWQFCMPERACATPRECRHSVIITITPWIGIARPEEPVRAHACVRTVIARALMACMRLALRRYTVHGNSA